MSTIMNLDDLLEETMGSVEAAPEFCDPETGVYDFELLKIKADVREIKDANKKAEAEKEGRPLKWPIFIMTYALNPVEVAEGNLPIKPGSLFSEDFSFTEQGKPYFKARIQAILAVNGATQEEIDNMSYKEMLLATEGTGLKGRMNITRTTYKRDDKEYTNHRVSNVVAIPQ
ncbi:hypothetical protein PP119X_gp34 [Pseudomonas phage 119X]|uniref:hypothetical protein n=1 Tax=Pseudomonas phage 119X TaxID=2911431 RepID=UPI00015294C9|nr:hypothetical protein PP119X_gp34 [Pseudomonas phage 119X]